jgi:peptidoglycan hydrolase FlgJ
MANEVNLNNTVKQGVTTARYNEKELNKIRKACADFESVITYQLMKTMRQTVPKGLTTSSNYGKDTYTMLMDQKIAEDLAAKGKGLGLQKVLFTQMTKSYTKDVSKEVIK